MTIDKQNGNIVSCKGEIMVGPEISFEDYKLYSEIKKTTFGMVCTSHFLDDSTEFNLTVLFDKSNHVYLIDIVIMLVNEKRKKTWDDWNYDEEIKRKHIHDEFLKALGISSKDDYAWGSVVSVYDEKMGGSVIRIKYKV